MSEIATIKDINKIKQEYRDLCNIIISSTDIIIDGVLKKLDKIESKVDKYLESIIRVYEDLSELRERVDCNDDRLTILEYEV